MSEYDFDFVQQVQEYCPNMNLQPLAWSEKFGDGWGDQFRKNALLPELTKVYQPLIVHDLITKLRRIASDRSHNTQLLLPSLCEYIQENNAQVSDQSFVEALKTKLTSLFNQWSFTVEQRNDLQETVVYLWSETIVSIQDRIDKVSRPTLPTLISELSTAYSLNTELNQQMNDVIKAYMEPTSDKKQRYSQQLQKELEEKVATSDRQRVWTDLAQTHGSPSSTFGKMLRESIAVQSTQLAKISEHLQSAKMQFDTLLKTFQQDVTHELSQIESAAPINTAQSTSDVPNTSSSVELPETREQDVTHASSPIESSVLTYIAESNSDVLEASNTSPPVAPPAQDQLSPQDIQLADENRRSTHESDEATGSDHIAAGGIPLGYQRQNTQEAVTTSLSSPPPRPLSPQHASATQVDVGMDLTTMHNSVVMGTVSSEGNHDSDIQKLRDEILNSSAPKYQYLKLNENRREALKLHIFKSLQDRALSWKKVLPLNSLFLTSDFAQIEGERLSAITINDNPEKKAIQLSGEIEDIAQYISETPFPYRFYRIFLADTSNVIVDGVVGELSQSMALPLGELSQIKTSNRVQDGKGDKDQNIQRSILKIQLIYKEYSNTKEQHELSSSLREELKQEFRNLSCIVSRHRGHFTFFQTHSERALIQFLSAPAQSGYREALGILTPPVDKDATMKMVEEFIAQCKIGGQDNEPASGHRVS